jgi:hypothetical protein
MTIYDMYVEWIDVQNTKIKQTYEKQLESYERAFHTYAIMASVSMGGRGQPPEQPKEPNFWIFDAEKYKKHIQT